MPNADDVEISLITIQNSVHIFKGYGVAPRNIAKETSFD